MEKIYIVEHYDSNEAEYAEDFLESTESFLFSTLEKAEVCYCKETAADYHGQYTIYEYELDTQKRTKIKESSFGRYDGSWDKANEWLVDNKSNCETLNELGLLEDFEQNYLKC